MMVEVVERSSLQKGSDLNKILNSTRKYYGLFSDGYVQFYDNWLESKGHFSDLEYKVGYDNVAELLIRLVNNGQLIIDIGCGVGTWSILLAKKGASVAGLDQSPEALLKCGEISASSNVKSSVFRVLGDGFYIPFGEEIFDGATLNWVLAHIPVEENRKFMKEVGRVLKGNAWLMISDSYWREQKGGKEQVQIRKTQDSFFQVYKYYYNPEELQNLLEDTFGEVIHLNTTPYEMLCVARKNKN